MKKIDMTNEEKKSKPPPCFMISIVYSQEILFILIFLPPEG